MPTFKPKANKKNCYKIQKTLLDSKHHEIIKNLNQRYYCITIIKKKKYIRN